MIPANSQDTVTTNMQGGQSFSIAATGKAFRILIDGIYANKIDAPVRELMANAYDAHAAAGCSDRPFVVFAPTVMDPIFRVRDYGTGMDHDTIMGLYTTLFDSSKTNTNDQVGMFGLGSKSPFAYTDQFTVTAYDGTHKRVYVAVVGVDAPTLHCLTPEPQACDEERGIEVTFPVAPRDVSQFVNAILRYTVAYDVRPQIDGAEITYPIVISEGDGWKVYKGHMASTASAMVRMGCVLYPMPSAVTSQVNIGGYNSTTVVDMPVGSLSPTASREALEDAHIDNLITTVKKVAEDMAKQVVDHIQTLTHLRYKHTYMIGARGFLPERVARDVTAQTGLTNEHVSLITEDDYAPFVEKSLSHNENYKIQRATQEYLKSNKIKPGRVLRRPGKNHNSNDAYEYTFLWGRSVDQLKIALNDEETPRAKGRMKQWASGYRNRFWLPVEGQAEAVAHLKKVLALTDDQFVKVSDLQDLPPRDSSTAPKGPKLSELRKALDNGALWVKQMRGTFYPASSKNAILPHHTEWWDYTLIQAVDALEDVFEDMEDKPGAEILTLRDSEIKKLNPPLTQSVSELLVWGAHRELPKYEEKAVHEETYGRLVSTGLSPRVVRHLMVTEMGTDPSATRGRNPKYPKNMNVAIQRYLQELLKSEDLINKVASQARDQMDAFKEKYPALFLDNDSAISYIDDVATNQEGADQA